MYQRMRQDAPRREGLGRKSRMQEHGDKPRHSPAPPIPAVVQPHSNGYLTRMKPFIDLIGASGAVYRFRLVEDPVSLPATGGNFAYVRATAKTEEVVGCGVARSLARAQASWPMAVEQHKANGIYVRLNVARIQREAEHDDLVAGVKPPMVLADVG